MKYPITPDYLTTLPDDIVALYEELDERIIEELCRRLGEYGQLTGTDIERIRILQRRGVDLEDILRLIQQTNQLSDAAFREVLQQVEADNQYYYDDLMTAAGIMQAAYQREALEQEAAAVSQQMQTYFGSVTGSLGFAVKDGAQVRVMGVGQAYQKVLNDAELDVYSGFKSAQEAIADAVGKLADSGIQWVDYPSGHHNRVDVAVRRAVQTGASQITAQYSNHYAQEMGTPYVEVSAHRGARDKDGKTPWANHKKWQGRVYSLDTEKGQKYPSVYAVCGLGEVDGLVGANCRHMYYPFLDGISERTWTDEELENIDGDPITFEGREYDAYEATQVQRRLETEMRRLKRRMIGFEAAGDEQRYLTAAARFKRIEDYYKRFSKAAKLPMQLDRAQVQGFGSQQYRKALSEAEFAIGKYDHYWYNKGGTIRVTDDWTKRTHPHLPMKYKPYAVIDTVTKEGTYSRTVYNSSGIMVKQVHSGDHGFPKNHPYGTHGEHVHDVVWDDTEGKWIREARDATALEEIRYWDILRGHK